MDVGDAWRTSVKPSFFNTRKPNTKHIIQSMAMYINGGTHAYYEEKSITIMYTIMGTNYVC